ncbi:uncharacterized protein METZ01_LOCUS403885 [marine metagenome]|uniref:Uncharacterized protein n=1 Tax=marine metagenome TaxID=408172 RepID=A0A382VYR9_9ZZZZ
MESKEHKLCVIYYHHKSRGYRMASTTQSVPITVWYDYI